METQKNELEACLTRAFALVENGVKSVVSDLGFEKENLADLVPNEDEATQAHLSQLEELVKGLRDNLASLKDEISTARSLVAKLGPGEPEEEGETEGEGEREIDLSAKEAGEIRHDEPVTLGTVLRSLLMANEPAQRERAEKELPS